MAFAARLAGRCTSCHGSIDVGDQVRYGWVRRDGEVLELVMHETCPDRANEARPATVCTACWLEQPCGCDA